VWAWQIAYAIRTKQIRPAPVVKGRSQWAKVEIQAPPSTWADPQDAADADAKNMLAGNTLHRTVLGRRGVSDTKEHYRRRAQEERWALDAAAEFNVNPDKVRSIQVSGQAATPSNAPTPEPKGTP
jgi:hypothetical protein